MKRLQRTLGSCLLHTGSRGLFKPFQKSSLLRERFGKSQGKSDNISLLRFRMQMAAKFCSTNNLTLSHRMFPLPRHIEKSITVMILYSYICTDDSMINDGSYGS